MKEQFLFTAEQFAENESKKQKLIKLIKSEDAVLMAGAGLSASLYPDWGKFVKTMYDAALEKDGGFNASKDDYLVFFNEVKKCLEAAHYYHIIYATFQPGNPTHRQFHETLCSMPFKGFTTTNYDLVLESALHKVTSNNPELLSMYLEGENKTKVHEFLQSLNRNSAYQRRVLHLHGRYDIPDSIILCEQEYRSKYGFQNKSPKGDFFDTIRTGGISREDFSDMLVSYGYEWPIRRKIIWSLLATRRVVFMGFSMTDPYFRKMFEFVSNDINPFGADSHFLVLRLTEENRKSSFEFAKILKREFGIETVFFGDDDTYLGLEQFIAELGAMVMGDTIDDSKKAEEKPPPPGVDKTGDFSITEKLLAISNKQMNDEN